MPAMTKEKELRASCCHLILDRIACIVCCIACLGESEGLEVQWIFVNLLIGVDGETAATKVPLGMNVPSEM